jgi:hypothetical protein
MNPILHGTKYSCRKFYSHHNWKNYTSIRSVRSQMAHSLLLYKLSSTTSAHVAQPAREHILQKGLANADEVSPKSRTQTNKANVSASHWLNILHRNANTPSKHHSQSDTQRLKQLPTYHGFGVLNPVTTFFASSFHFHHDGKETHPKGTHVSVHNI